jgi:hypothetical protein
MFNDPIISEIRKNRLKLEAEFQNDSQKYYDHLLEIQKKYSNRLVRRQPKPALKLTKVV